MKFPHLPNFQWPWSASERETKSLSQTVRSGRISHLSEESDDGEVSCCRNKTRWIVGMLALSGVVLAAAYCAGQGYFTDAYNGLKGAIQSLSQDPTIYGPTAAGGGVAVIMGIFLARHYLKQSKQPKLSKFD